MRNKRVDNKQKEMGLLDQTVNDFEDDKVFFRYPKKNIGDTQVSDGKIKSKGRPKRSTKNSSKNKTNVSTRSKAVVNITDLPKELSQDAYPNSSHTVSPVSNPDLKVTSSPDIIELEKSICSESEKLCPSCKHIVLVDEYSSHVSKCLQKFSYTKDRNNSKENLSRILPCPVCLKAFTSANEKQNHVKSCGFSHGMTPQQLIEATKLQAKQEEERLALGLPSPQVVQTSKDNRKKLDGTKPRGLKSSDPELELAYALSRSLVEEERKKREIEEDKLVSLGFHDILQEKRRKLVLPQPPPLPSTSKGTRGLKGKRKGKVVTALMTRTQEERETITTEKVAAILAGEYDIPIIPPENLCDVKQTSKFIHDDIYDKDFRLWKFACTGLEVPPSSHYVSELSDYIRPKIMSFPEILKKYYKNSGKLNYSALAEDSDENEEESDGGAPVETTIVDAYCTQLALAELLCTQNINELTFGPQYNPREKTKMEAGTLIRPTTHRKDKNCKTDSETDSEFDSEIDSISLLSSDEDDATTSSIPFSPRQLEEETSSTIQFSPWKLEEENEFPKICGISVPSAPAEIVCPNELDSPFSSKLIYDWSCLLANGDQSDLMILTDSSQIPVHSLVFFCRCSKILAEIIDEESDSIKEDFSLKKKWLDWSKFSHDAAYAFMVYLYTGGCPVKGKEKDDNWFGLYDLALKYGCSELIEHLESMYKSLSKEETEKEDQENLTETPISESINLFNKQKPSQSLADCSYIDRQRIPMSISGECDSPDIFGEWEVGERSSAPMDSVNVTPAGVTIDNSTIQDYKTPVLNLEDASSNYSVNTTKDSVVKSNLSDRATPVLNLEDKSPNHLLNTTKDSSVKSNLSTKTTLALNLEDKSPNYFGNTSKDSAETKGLQNNSIGSEKSNKAVSKRNLSYEFKNVADSENENCNSFVNMPESPSLRMSTFSDIDYPSGNELVDLTVSSDDEKDTKISPYKQDKEIITKEFKEQDISLPVLEHSPKNSPSLSFLINEPISNTRKDDSFDLSNIEILSPKNLPGDAKLSNSVPRGISDDSLLMAVCDMENGLQERAERKLSEKNFKKPHQKLYKSKSYTEDSPRTMVTPDKGIDSEFPSNSNYNITPMPDYKSMLSPDLRKELDKFGIRKMSRKKAITLLLHIYEETHPFVTDSETEESLEDSVESIKKAVPSPPPPVDKPKGKTKRNGVVKGKTKAKKPCEVDLNSSLSSNTSADTSFECLEETFLPCSQDEADDISATQEVSLENRIKTFIRSDDELYTRILRYDPIWANELLGSLKLNGIKCSMAKLISFLDEQCITFRIPTKERTRKRRRKNTNTSPGKSPKKKRK